MTALSTIRPGASVRVVQLTGEPEVATRLREMGIYEQAVIRCLQSGAACVCLVQQSRVALSGQLASRIMVEPLR